jgi:hypothetical protein
MAQIQITPGNHSLSLPVTAFPAGQPCAVAVVLTSDAAGQTVVATGAQTTFTSTGASQNVAPAVSVPAVAGIYYVYIAGYMNGVQVAYAEQTNTLLVPSFTIGQGTWS